jgi:hypothetical protein
VIDWAATIAIWVQVLLPPPAQGQVPPNQPTTESPVSQITITVPTVPTPTIPLPTTTEPSVPTIPPLPTVETPTLPLPTTSTTERGGTTTRGHTGTTSVPTPSTSTTVSSTTVDQAPPGPLHYNHPENLEALNKALVVDNSPMQAAFSLLGFTAGLLIGLAIGCYRCRSGKR